MRAFQWVKTLLSCDRGNAMIVAAAAMPFLIGAAAIGVDTIQLTLARRQLQRAADAGALAGAYALVQSKPVTAAVDRDLTLNNGITLSTPRVVENAPTTGSYAGNTRAVRVLLTAQRTTPFMAFFNGQRPTVQVEATAAVVFTGKFCMVSLETGNVTGITFTGNTTVDLGCGVASNSTASAGVAASGSATVTASPIAAVGGVPSSSAYVSPTTLLPYSPKQTDPFAGLPRTPSPPSDCTTVSLDAQPNRTNDLRSTISPSGNYCVKNGADIKGSTYLAPGTYYIDGGTFNLGSQAYLEGTGVTIVLTSSTPSVSTSFAAISMNGGAVVKLSPPTSGTYSGVLMYQDPRTPYANAYINGNSASSYEGALYFPSQQLTFNGNTGMQTQCLQLVALRLIFSGNSKVENTCPANSGAHAFDAIFVRLVA